MAKKVQSKNDYFIGVRKLQLTIIHEDENIKKDMYKFIRDSIYAQYLAMNKAMSYISTAYYFNNMDLKSEEFKKHLNSLTNSWNGFDGINFGKGIDTKSLITQRVKKDFSTAIKNGLAKGERSITNYKRTYPLMTRGRDIKFYQDENDDYYIKWVNKTVFKVILGSKVNKNYVELQHFLRKVLNNEYSILQSSIEFNKKNKLILNLTCKIPNTKNNDFVNGRVVGVDLGMKIPAYVTLNDDDYSGQAIGSIDDLLRVRTQFNKRRKRLQKRLKISNGGHGRGKKLKALESLSDKERNYVKNYNHNISRLIIEYAKKNRAGQINMEFLALSNEEKESVMSSIRWWSYYELQTMVEYKANREGIVVKYVDPYRTSQICSCCGHWEDGQRLDQETFKCKNDKCGHVENADRNASRNIARSEKYITNKEQSQFYKNRENFID